MEVSESKWYLEGMCLIKQSVFISGRFRKAKNRVLVVYLRQALSSWMVNWLPVFSTLNNSLKSREGPAL